VKLPCISGQINIPEKKKSYSELKLNMRWGSWRGCIPALRGGGRWGCETSNDVSRTQSPRGQLVPGWRAAEGPVFKAAKEPKPGRLPRSYRS